MLRGRPPGGGASIEGRCGDELEPPPTVYVQCLVLASRLPEPCIICKPWIKGKMQALDWCWHRWANEQARQLDPAQAALDDDPDTWDEALGFLDACGPVSRGHIARTVSTEHNLGQSLHSHGSGLSSGFLEESQREVASSSPSRAFPGCFAVASLHATVPVNTCVFSSKASQLLWHLNARAWRL